MRVIYDPATDSLDLIFREEPKAESDEIRKGIIADYAQDGKMVSLEVLDASEHVAEPKSIAYELKGRRMSLKVSYDQEADVLYLAKEGQEEEVVEVYPGVNLEFGPERELLGIEILGASRIL